MRRKAIAGALLAALAAGIVWTNTRVNPIAVTLRPVERGTVERTVSNTRAGTVKACRRSSLSLRGGGRVEVLHVKEGDGVVPGALLLETWNADRKAMLAQAEAEQQAAAHRREQLCVESANARRESDRLTTLRQRNLVSQEATEAAQTRASAANFACRAAGDQLDTAAATTALQRALLADTQLRAPFAGVIAELKAEVGEYVTPSPPGIPMPPAVDLIDYSCLYVSAPIDEIDAALLRTGQPARINLDAFRDQPFAGKVKRVAPYVLEIEKQARTVEVEVLFDDPDARGRLLVGYSADIDVILESRERVLRIPTEALLEDDTVWRYDARTGRVARVKVVPGIRNWNHTEITSGLAEGDRVVISLDQPGLVDGARATPADD